MLKSKLFYFIVIILFLIGLGVRLFDLMDAPLDFHPTRQLHSALIARGMYAQMAQNSVLSEEKTAIAIQQWKMEGLIEPPIMEWLTAVGYVVLGEPVLWFPRLLSIFFWLLAGLGILLVGRSSGIGSGMLMAISVFFFYPYAVIASRSFQPESLLVASISLFVFCAVRWHAEKSWKWTIIAGLLGGMAIFIKSIAVFFVAGVWIGILLTEENIFQLIKNKKLWVAGLITILPYFFFHIYGVYVLQTLAGQFSLRFFPQMWLQPSFYLRWISSLRGTIALEWILLAWLGIALTKNKTMRSVLLGLWIGYFLFGLTLPYHISTHDYYHLPLFIPIALGIGLISEEVMELFRQKVPWQKIIATLGVIILFTLLIFDARSFLSRVDFSDEQKFWKEMGKKLENTTTVAALSQDYGYRLAYWGWKTPLNWPSVNDINLREFAGQRIAMSETFEEISGKADYFLITDFQELERQPYLLDWLYDKYYLLERGEQFLLFFKKN